MNRKTITSIFLGISLLLNVVLFVFGYIQKISADTQKSIILEKERQCLEQSQVAKAELDTCEVRLAESEAAREECEQKLLSLSNRKK